MKYVTIGVIGVIFILKSVTEYIDKPELAATRILVTIVTCTMSVLLFVFNGNALFSYILTFAIGTYVVFAIFVFSAFLAEHHMEIVWISYDIITIICSITSFATGTNDLLYLKYISLGLLGISCIILIFIIFYNDIEEAIIGTVLIIASCIVTGLIFGFSDTSGMKYILVSAIGIYITLIAYVFTAMCDEDYINDILGIGFCILIICFIIMSFYNSIIRIITIILFVIYVLAGIIRVAIEEYC